jgi:alpha-tubulin suppressor-like RCC1 family protein
MNRRERFLIIGLAPLTAAIGLFACSDDDSRPAVVTTPDAAPDSPASLPPDPVDEPDGGSVVDARVPFDGSDEPVVCTAKPCVTQLVSGGTSFCALLDDKTVRCWGSTYRAFGTMDGGGSGGAQTTPLSIGLSNVEQISSGNLTICARLTDGSVTCWGGNQGNELGLEPPRSDYGPHDPAPVAIDGGVLSGFTRVDVGVTGAVFATKAGGELWSWGDNASSMLGRMNEGTSFLGPGRAVDLAGEKIRRAGANAGAPSIAFAITDEGRLLTWGTSQVVVAYPGPVPMPVAGFENVSSVSVASNNLCAVADGHLYCWGQNGNMACTGTADAVLDPLEIRTRGEARPQQVNVFHYHTCVRLADGTLQCCGNNSFGQLGIGEVDAGTTTSPLLTEAKAVTGHVVQVALNLYTTCALMQGGTVQCWGQNDSGQLGQGTRDNERHPIPVTVKFD